MTKKSPLKLAKDNAWKSFSAFIRVRDCLRTSGTLDSGVCISCKKEVSYKGSQAGHFIAGRTNSILLDEDLVHLQCMRCNIMLSGNYVEYFVGMEELYSREDIDVLRARKNQTKKMRIDDWKEEKTHWDSRKEELVRVFNSEGRWSLKLAKLLELKRTF